MESNEILAALGGAPIIKQNTVVNWPAPNLQDAQALIHVTKYQKYHRVNHPVVNNVEDNIAHWCNFKYCRAVNSGTAALHICIDKIKQNGKKVIVSALNWPGAVAPIYFSGMQAVFVDVSLNDACSDENAIFNALDNDVIAIMTTHLFGNPSYIKRIREYIQLSKKPLYIIDDCSQAIYFCKELGKNPTTHTDAVAFSGNGAKHLAAGEIGFICSDREEIINHVDSVSLSSSSRNGSRIFSPYSLGFNYRPNVFSASVANSRLLTLDEQIQKRQENVSYLISKIKNIEGLKPIFNPNDKNNSFYYATFRIDFDELSMPVDSQIRDIIVKLLQLEGLPVAVWLNRPVWEYMPWCKNETHNILDVHNTNHILNTMFCLTEVAPPNNIYVMELYVKAIKKVWDFILLNKNKIKNQFSHLLD